MTDDEFNSLCEAHSFGAVARGEFPLVSRGLLKALVDAAVAAERERWGTQVRAMHEADDAYGTGFYNGLEWRQHYAELRRMCGMDKA